MIHYYYPKIGEIKERSIVYVCTYEDFMLWSVPHNSQKVDVCLSILILAKNYITHRAEVF